MDDKEQDDEIIGKQVVVKECEAKIHDNDEGCVCALIGKVVRIDGRNKDMISGIGRPSYKIERRNKYVKRSEVEFLKKE